MIDLYEVLLVEAYEDVRDAEDLRAHFVVVPLASASRELIEVCPEPPYVHLVFPASRLLLNRAKLVRCRFSSSI
jgi:hypothetical protein